MFGLFLFQRLSAKEDNFDDLLSRGYSAKDLVRNLTLK